MPGGTVRRRKRGAHWMGTLRAQIYGGAQAVCLELSTQKIDHLVVLAFFCVKCALRCRFDEDLRQFVWICLRRKQDTHVIPEVYWSIVHFLLGNALGDQISDVWFLPFLVSDGECIN